MFFGRGKRTEEHNTHDALIIGRKPCIKWHGWVMKGHLSTLNTKRVSVTDWLGFIYIFMDRIGKIRFYH